MMKKSILLTINLLLAGLCVSQVAINTENPKGVFHIDAKGDTGVQGVEFSDDIVVNTEGQMGIGTLTPQAKLDINGNLRIADAPVIANAKVLVRDGVTGLVGTAVSVPTKVAFVQSAGIQKLTTQAEKDSFNTGAPVQVTWSPVDIVSNNVVDFDDASDVFIISQTGLYELSGFLNYATYSTIPETHPTEVNAGRSGVNVSIQVDKNDGKGWTDFTAARIVFTGTAVNNTAQSIIVPPGVLIFDKGTKIRMVFLRPSQYFGLAHGTSGDNGISLPVGILFSKGMKILAL